jgi:hypothetical protein
LFDLNGLVNSLSPHCSLNASTPQKTPWLAQAPVLIIGKVRASRLGGRGCGRCGPVLRGSCADRCAALLQDECHHQNSQVYQQPPACQAADGESAQLLNQSWLACPLAVPAASLCTRQPAGLHALACGLHWSQAIRPRVLVCMSVCVCAERLCGRRATIHYYLLTGVP